MSNIPDNKQGDRQVEKTYDDVVKAAEKSGLILIDSVFSNKSRYALEVPVSVEEFLKLIATCQLRVIYHSYNRLNLTEDVAEQFRDALEIGTSKDAEGYVYTPTEKRVLEKHLNNKKSKDFLNRWSECEGKFEYVIFDAVVDGVVHHLASTSHWHIEYDAELESLTEEILGERNSQEEAGRIEGTRKIKELAKELANHQLFKNDKGRPRVSREKRIFLAEELFPNESGSTHVEIVDVAANMLWYESGGETA